MANERETLKSRLGFILVSAGCAIGLGNVWRFPYITGKNGGAAFVLFYLLFLIILGLPCMIFEFSIGRASKQNIGLSLKTLEPPKTKWHVYGPMAIGGNYLLMMFYTTIAGWLLYYMCNTGSIFTMASGAVFEELTSNPGKQIIWMAIACTIGMGVCALGLSNGVEKITKVMMLALLAIMLILAVNSCFIPGGVEGLKFYLVPDFTKMQEIGFGTVVFEALGQAFFTLSLGIGSMSIFGSYIGKERTLAGESIRVIALDTFVALMSGLIIFPACFAYNTNPDAGPSLLFVTLPTIFEHMVGGKVISVLFFLFMSFAALSTVIAVFENIVSYWIDVHHWSRTKSCVVNLISIVILSIPCILGFNVLSGFQPLGPGTGVLDLEDFIVSTTLLPLGSLLFVIFCTSKKGWGWENSIKEANTGIGAKLPQWTKFYIKYVLPLIFLYVFIQGYINTFKNFF